MSETVFNEALANPSSHAEEPQHAERLPDTPAPPETAEITLTGPRKLVRPKLPEGAMAKRTTLRTSVRSNFTKNARLAALSTSLAPHNYPQPTVEHAHAETLYLQKQIQLQTAMVVMLEDGEQLEGVIEWYDQLSIKLWLTNRQRVLVYKDAIKYMHKASEAGAKAEFS